MIYWLTQTPEDMPKSSTGIDLRWLTTDEYRRADDMPGEIRRQNWLLGRWTAKRLLQKLTWRTAGMLLPLDQFSVIHRPDGSLAAITAGVSADYALSLSHTEGCALCAVSEGNVPVGAAIEQIVEPRSAGWHQDYFTPAEMAAVERASERMRSLVITAIWAGKEGALASLRSEDTNDARIMSCLIEPVEEAPEHWMAFRAVRADERSGKTTPALDGWWQTHGPYVMAIVAGRGSSEGPQRETAIQE